MEELHRTADKFERESEHLTRQMDRLLDSAPLDEDQIALALSIAKRVRRESTLLVRQLAQLRDHLQP